MKSRNIILVVGLLISSIISSALTGCTFTGNLVANPLNKFPQQDKINLHVVLVLTPEFSNFAWEVGGGLSDTIRISMGESLSENAEALARAVYRDVTVTNVSKPSEKSDADAFLIPQANPMGDPTEESSVKETKASIEVVWTLLNPQNELVWVKPVEGVGYTKHGMSWTVKGIMENMKVAANEAIDDLYLQSYDEMFNSVEIRNFTTSH